ncbi:MAG: hypothetical protein IPM16_06665 [Chloroflexi bacterium]|nr:hypothetical protein [Chloroflexota bacterium]
MAEAYIASDPFARLEYDRYGKRKSYFIPGRLRDDFKSLYHRQKATREYTHRLNFHALDSFEEKFVKDGLLRSIERPRVPRWPGDRDTTATFWAITAAGAEMLGLPALPDPAEPPELPYHEGAKLFVPPDAAHTVAVGDPVRVGKHLGRVHELREWPGLNVIFAGESWHNHVYATQVHPVDVEDDQPDPVALEDLNHAVARVNDHLAMLQREIRRWKSGPADALDGQTDTQAEALRLLAELSAVICKTHSAARIEMEPLEASVAPAGDPDDDEGRLRLRRRRRRHHLRRSGSRLIYDAGSGPKTAEKKTTSSSRIRIAARILRESSYMRDHLKHQRSK